MNPLFVHDCSRCTFIGTFAGMDVYTCRQFEGPLGISILARYGNEGPEYSSSPIKLFRDQFLNPEHTIAGARMPTMRFSEYLFSPHVIDYHKAWMLALASGKVQEEV